MSSTLTKIQKCSMLDPFYDDKGRINTTITLGEVRKVVNGTKIVKRQGKIKYHMKFLICCLCLIAIVSTMF